jgi:hypothetical protein
MLSLITALACGGSDTVPTPAASAAPPAAPAVVGLAKPTGVPLQALVATSGDAWSLLDGSAGSGWSPTGVAAGEGVLLRFEDPTPVDSVQIDGCGGSPTLRLYVNGNMGDNRDMDGAVSWDVGGATVRSMFVKIEAGDDACLGELTVASNGSPLDLQPPRAIGGSVKASSTLDPADAYHPSYLFDARTDFGWVEGVDGLGVGETLTLTLDQELELFALELWNGYQRSPDHFAKNARAAAISVSTDGGSTWTPLVVQDTQGSQKLTLPAGVKTKTVTLRIDDAVAGSRYKDLVLSELRLWDSHGPVTVRTSDQSARIQALQTQAKGTAVGQVMDTRMVGVCDEGGWRELKLRSNHSFVWYAEQESSTQVFDGAWVMTSKTEVKLYGRMHAASEQWVPYEGVRATEQVRIAGGGVTLTPVSSLSESQAAALFKRVGDRAWETTSCLDGVGYESLKSKGAVVVEGKALTDVVWPG